MSLPSQYLYLHTYGSQNQTDPSRASSNSLRLSMRGAAGQGGGSGAGRGSAELERLLNRIAPDKEVMIAISNYNLIRTGMLPTWLEASYPYLLVISTRLRLRPCGAVD